MADHGEGELFPRALTSELVGEAEVQRRGRERVSLALCAAGLTALALGVSDPRVLPGGVALAAEASAGGLPRPWLSGLLVRWLAPAFGLENAAYLLSAIFFGA